MLSPSEEGNWIRTDEREELLELCHFAAEYADGPVDQLSTWRWLILSSVMSFQSACVCAIDGAGVSRNNVFRATKRQAETGADALGNWFATNPDQPVSKGKLAEPGELLRRIQRPDYLPQPHTISITSDAIRDLRKLIKFRNGFIHFEPQGWSIEITGLPRMVDACWGVIEQLAILRPTFNRHLSSSQQNQIRQSIHSVRASMHKIGIHK